MLWPQLLFALCMWVLTLVPEITPAPFIEDTFLERYGNFLKRSHAEHQYLCSDEENSCVLKEKLLYPEDERCYAVGARGPCAPHQVFRANKTEASRPGGHLRGACEGACRGGSRFPLSSTGECLSRAEVEEMVCRAAWGLRAALDAFAEWVCEWAWLPCPLDAPPERVLYSADLMSFLRDGRCLGAEDIFRASYPPPGDAVKADLPQGPSADAAARHPWQRFFADNSRFAEREFPCTEEERACLEFGRVLYADGKCYRAGERPTDACEEGTIWAGVVDGHLRAVCGSFCEDAASRPMQSTDKCFDMAQAEEEICRVEWGMNAVESAYGQWECMCYNTWLRPPPTPPPTPSTPTAPGHCRHPDFADPTLTPIYDSTLEMGFLVPCSVEEYACLREGRVLAGGACHALRTQGPCADGEQLLLDKEALAHARLEAVCRALPCPVGSVPMPIDGRCLTHEQVTTLLCPGWEVALDEFGGWQCNQTPDFPGFLEGTVRLGDGSCELSPTSANLSSVSADGSSGFTDPMWATIT